MPKYSETHHLNIDDAGLASVHVAVHLQDADPRIARLLVLRVLDTASTIAYLDPLILSQTSGPCVHYDERSEYAADAYPCTYPYGDGTCPHLDNPEILCPVKDSLYAMREVARMRDKCETEQEEQVSSLCGYYDERSEHADNIDPCTHPDACKTGCPYLDDDGIYCPQKDGWSAASKQAEEDLAWAWGDDIPKFVPLAQDPEGGGTDMVAEAPDTIPRSDYVPAPEDPGRLHTYVVEPEPEFPEPAPEEEPVYEAPPPVGEMRLDARGWTPEEERALRGATTPAEAVALYRAAYPGSSRTDAAIKSRYHQKIRPRRHGADGPLPDFAGDTVPVTQCDEEAFAVPRPTFRPGDRVRIVHPLHRGHTGEIVRYFPATENYLVAIDGMPDMIVLRDKDLEVEA